MTMMLASVRSVYECELALDAGVDIIDLKNPDHGALGALDITVINNVVDSVNGRVPVSATIGDLPWDIKYILPRVKEFTATGIDLIKIGIFGKTDDFSLLDKLQPFIDRGTRIVIVVFAENEHSLDQIDQLTEFGISGVMLDTCDKSSGSLLAKQPMEFLDGFVKRVRKAGKFCGLAGSLSIQNIPQLLLLNPDYLGFRGAICSKENRTCHIDAVSLERVRKLIPKNHVSYIVDNETV